LPAVHLKYVGHAALTDRLLDVDPEWSWEPLALDSNGLPLLDNAGGMWIRLTVLGVSRLGYGDAQGKVGGDAMKERIGDALRNAAMRFGAALELWHKGDLHGDDDGDTGDNTDNKKETEPENKTLSAPITPTSGAGENLTPEQANKVTDIALSIVDLLIEGREYDAFELLEASGLDADEKVALWRKLDSKQRAAIKKQAAKAKEPA
jgi:hypothetical protein